MQTSEALSIIQALADGADPNTGEVFPDSSPYQHPQIVRALLTAARALERQERAERQKRRLPERAGKPWDDAEDERLAQGFDAGIAVGKLARQHERTEGAIRARLEKLGKIPPRGQYPGPSHPTRST
jgi:hypothetical protein